jgi:hypothetical protein
MPRFRHEGPIDFKTQHEVELPSLQDWHLYSRIIHASDPDGPVNRYTDCCVARDVSDSNRYVVYTVEVHGRCYPPFGREPAYSEVESIVVTKIEITRPDGQEITIERGFTGPMEPGIVPIGSLLEMTGKEQDQLARECSAQLYAAYESALGNYRRNR